MAITWGAWESSGGNGMRVGIEVFWDPVSNTSTSVAALVDIWTENEATYNDAQTLTYGGSISGTKNFTNAQGGTATYRDTKNYTYTYGASEYGSSPASKTFSATLSGAFNGVTPTVSKSSAVPARPYGIPNVQTNITATRSSDTFVPVEWTINPTAGKPYDSQQLQRRLNGGGWVTISSALSGTGTSYGYATNDNNKYEFQIRATNSVGSSAYSATSNAVWTTPAAPTSASRSGASGANQVITWVNTALYTEYNTEVFSSQNGGAYTLLATVGSGVTSYTHTGPPSASIRWKYKVRHKTTVGTVLYGPYSNETSESGSTSSAPSAPTGLAPSGGIVVNQMVSTTLTWQHNPTDATAQSKYTVQHRVVGNPTWTTTADTVSTSSQHVLAANTYAGGQNIEWQVRTFGADPTASAYSASGTFTTLALVARLPVVVNLSDGTWEVGSEIQAGTAAGVAGTLLLNNMGGDVRMFDQSATNPLFRVGGSDAKELRLGRASVEAFDGAAVSLLTLNGTGGDVQTGGPLTATGLLTASAAATITGALTANGSALIPILRAVSNAMATEETTVSTTYVALATATEVSVTKPASLKIIVVLSGECKIATAGNSSRLSFEVTTATAGGGTVIASALDSRSANNANPQYATVCRVALITGADSGASWFVRVVKKSPGGVTATFNNITLTVIPVP